MTIVMKTLEKEICLMILFIFIVVFFIFFIFGEYL